MMPGSRPDFAITKKDARSCQGPQALRISGGIKNVRGITGTASDRVFRGKKERSMDMSVAMCT